MPINHNIITLRDAQDVWIVRQIARRASTNSRQYFPKPVCRDRVEQAKLACLKQAIAAGLESGVSDRSLETIWGETEARA